MSARTSKSGREITQRKYDVSQPILWGVMEELRDTIFDIYLNEIIIIISIYAHAF